MSAYLVPSISDFKAQFVRDFNYGADSTVVMDSDLTTAMTTAGFNFNGNLFDSQQNFTLCYLLLSAHFLVMNLRASSQGIGGQFTWLQSGKGVGSVNESIAIPQRILDNPEFSYLAKTNYGAQYLMLILPMLSGQMFAVHSRTNP